MTIAVGEWAPAKFEVDWTRATLAILAQPAALVALGGVGPDHVQQLHAIATRFKSARATAFTPTPFSR